MDSLPLPLVQLIVLAMPVAFAIHELEEWNILAWYKRHYARIPDSTNRSIRAWIVFISLAVFILSAVAALAIGWELVFSPLIIALSAFMLTNVIQHVVWTIQYGEYSVGLGTALFLCVVVATVHAVLNLNNLINAWFYFILLYVALPVIKTIRSPRVMTPEIEGIHRLGLRLENLFFGKK